MEHEAAMAGKGGERGSIHKGEGRFGSFHNLFSLTLKALTPASSSNTLAVAPAAGESGSGGTKGKHKKASSEDSDDGEHAHHGGRTPVSNASSSDHTASTVGTAMQTPATAPPPQPATPATITATATAPDPHCPYSSSSSSSKKRCRLFIVLDASGVNFTDLSGMRALADVNQDLREHGVRLLIARAKHRLRDKLRLDPALFRDLGGEMMYLSLEELVLLLERHDMRLHGTPFPSCTDLRALGGNTSAVLPPGAIMGVVCASSEASSQAATPPNGTMSPTVVDAAAAEAAATAGPTPVPAPAALAALAASVSGSWRAMGKQASSSPSGGLAPMVNVVVQEPVIGESGEKDKEDDYAVGVEPGGVVNGAGSSQVNSSAASDAEEDAAIGGSHGRIV